MTEIIEQMKFCDQLEMRLSNAVILHENCRNTLNKSDHRYLASYNGIAERGATKTQIMADIVRLRRELNVLSRMFDDWREPYDG